MSRFAIVNKKTNIVENSVVADNGSVIALIFEDKNIYEETETTGPIFIGGDFYKGKFRTLSPFKSWVYNEVKNQWEPPKPYPTDGKLYAWDEDTKDWIKVNDSL